MKTCIVYFTKVFCINDMKSSWSIYCWMSCWPPFYDTDICNIAVISVLQVFCFYTMYNAAFNKLWYLTPVYCCIHMECCDIWHPCTFVFTWSVVSAAFVTIEVPPGTIERLGSVSLSLSPGFGFYLNNKMLPLVC